MKHVLIIEEDPRVGLALETTLARLGFRSFCKVVTEDDAVAAAAARPPDLIVVGDHLAAGSPIRAARRIADTREVPMLLVAAHREGARPSPPADATLVGPFALDAAAEAVAEAEQPLGLPAAA